jgi:hypothetical protein
MQIVNPEPDKDAIMGTRPMKHFEFEIPGIIIWKFTTIEDAILRTIHLMSSLNTGVYIYHLQRDIRQGVVIRLEKDGNACPFCGSGDMLVRVWSTLAQYDDLLICRVCRQSFKA